MDIYVTRHGQTFGNVQRILQGQQPGELTDLGTQQARELARRLQGEHFDFVYSSDLNRCVQTLSEVMQFHPYASPILDERLREKSAGELEGQPLGTTDRLAKEAGLEPRQFRAPRGESWEDVMNRANTFFNDICQVHLNEQPCKILVVSHGGWIMELLNVLRQFKREKPVYANKSANTALYVIRVQRKSNKIVPTLVVDNDASHLKNIRNRK